MIADACPATICARSSEIPMSSGMLPNVNLACRRFAGSCHFASSWGLPTPFGMPITLGEKSDLDTRVAFRYANVAVRDSMRVIQGTGRSGVRENSDVRTQPVEMLTNSATGTVEILTNSATAMLVYGKLVRHDAASARQGGRRWS